MSAFIGMQTQFTDTTFLVQALKDCGLQPELHEEPVALKGWAHHAKEFAEIVVPAKSLNTYEDLGFQRQKDGTFKAIVNDTQESRFDESWLRTVTQKYARQSAIAYGASKGLRLVEELDSPVKGVKTRMFFEPVRIY